jgi:hypothetical protein
MAYIEPKSTRKRYEKDSKSGVGLFRRTGYLHHHPLLKENYDGCEVIAVSGNVGRARNSTDWRKGAENRRVQTVY